MSIHLSNRLQAVADAVPAGSRIIDVGTDHAMIPVWLIQTERVLHAWASDIRRGPLQSAGHLISETNTGHSIDLRMTDGLQGFCAEDGDTIILAGMGGETMVSILSGAPWTKNGSLLILEPQSKQAVLRRWLTDNEYIITRESLVKDAGRIYPILLVSGGTPKPYSEAELHTGRYEAISKDSLFGEYLDILIKRTAAAAPYDEYSRKLLSDLENMKRSLCPCIQ